MLRIVWIGAASLFLGLALAGSTALAIGGGDGGDDPAGAGRSSARVAEKPAPPSPADAFAALLAEYNAKQEVCNKAMDAAATQEEQQAIYTKLAPSMVEYAGKFVELAEAHPDAPAARDAALWALECTNHVAFQVGPFHDVVSRAVAVLVAHHADDLKVARVGLHLTNDSSEQYDRFYQGVYDGAQDEAAKATAALGLAKFLGDQAMMARAVRKVEGPMVERIGGFDEDGKAWTKDLGRMFSDEYEAELRAADPDALDAEADRLYEHVLAEHADIPYQQESVLYEAPKTGWPTSTLGAIAQSKLDDRQNLAVGRPAPEIEGKDLDGNPLKLSDHRGKVVALVFWGSWCGPCMRAVPHEKALVERLKDQPFAMLGVNTDDTLDAARKTVAESGITWPNWHDGPPDEGPITRRYHVPSYPTIVVIDADGIIRSKATAGEALDSFVDTLLEELEKENSGE